jgi:hypothetical protein
LALGVGASSPSSPSRAQAPTTIGSSSCHARQSRALRGGDTCSGRPDDDGSRCTPAPPRRPVAIPWSFGEVARRRAARGEDIVVIGWRVPHGVLFLDLPCKFCYRSVCPEGHDACLQRLLPERVIAMLDELLEAGTDATTISASTGS